MAAASPYPLNIRDGGMNSTISYNGVIALWIGFAFTVVAGLFFLVLSYIRNVKPEARLTYYLVTLINAITALAYLIMALGGTWGWAEYVPNKGTAVLNNQGRGFHWLRYASWVIVTPLTLVILGLLSGAHWVDQIWLVFVSIVAVAALFASAISQGFNATWPLYAFAGIAGVVVIWGMSVTYRSAAYKLHAEIGKLYDVVGLGSAVLSVCYYVFFGTSEGGKLTTVDQEVIVYACLDIVSKAVFGFVLIYSREAIARYGSWLGQINTGVDFDFPIARSTVMSSANGYSTEGGHAIVYGEHRDLAFAQLHGATGTALTTQDKSA